MACVDISSFLVRACPGFASPYVQRREARDCEVAAVRGTPRRRPSHPGRAISCGSRSRSPDRRSAAPRCRRRGGSARRAVPVDAARRVRHQRRSRSAHRRRRSPRLGRAWRRVRSGPEARVECLDELDLGAELGVGAPLAACSFSGLTPRMTGMCGGTMTRRSLRYKQVPLLQATISTGSTSTQPIPGIGSPRELRSSNTRAIASHDHAGFLKRLTLALDLG